MLAGWLEFHRATLLAKCDGFNDEQRKRRPVVTSLMSLHGLVRHTAEVERIEEYARHNGHADLIRELIDGRGGC